MRCSIVLASPRFINTLIQAKILFMKTYKNLQLKPFFWLSLSWSNPWIWQIHFIYWSYAQIIFPAGFANQGSISPNFAKSKWQKVTSKLQLCKSHKFYSAPTSPKFVQKCFVKWLFSFFVICAKKPRINKLMKLMPGGLKKDATKARQS